MLRNALIWVLLVTLSAASFVAGESAPGRLAAAILLPVAAVKAFLVAWQYMELRTAHVAWRLGFLALLTVFLGLFALLATRP